MNEPPIFPDKCHTIASVADMTPQSQILFNHSGIQVFNIYDLSILLPAEPITLHAGDSKENIFEYMRQLAAEAIVCFELSVHECVNFVSDFTVPTVVEGCVLDFDMCRYNMVIREEDPQILFLLATKLTKEYVELYKILENE